MNIWKYFNFLDNNYFNFFQVKRESSIINKELKRESAIIKEEEEEEEDIFCLPAIASAATSNTFSKPLQTSRKTFSFKPLGSTLKAEITEDTCISDSQMFREFEPTQDDQVNSNTDMNHSTKAPVCSKPLSINTPPIEVKNRDIKPLNKTNLSTSISSFNNKIKEEEISTSSFQMDEFENDFADFPKFSSRNLTSTTTNNTITTTTTTATTSTTSTTTPTAMKVPSANNAILCTDEKKITQNIDDFRPPRIEDYISECPFDVSTDC